MYLLFEILFFLVQGHSLVVLLEYCATSKEDHKQYVPYPVQHNNVMSKVSDGLTDEKGNFSTKHGINEVYETIKL